MGQFTYEQTATAQSLLPGWLLPALLWLGAVFLVLLVLVLWYRRRRRWLLFLNHQDVPDIVYRLTGSGFETWFEQLLKSVGAKARQVGGRGDHGVDVMAEYRGKKIGIQCKKYEQWYVGESVVRDLYGAQRHFGLDEVWLVTTGNFSRPAVRWAKDKPDLVLVNGYALSQIMKDRRLLTELLER